MCTTFFLSTDVWGDVCRGGITWRSPAASIQHLKSWVSVLLSISLCVSLWASLPVCVSLCVCLCVCMCLHAAEGKHLLLCMCGGDGAVRPKVQGDWLCMLWVWGRIQQSDRHQRWADDLRQVFLVHSRPSECIDQMPLNLQTKSLWIYRPKASECIDQKRPVQIACHRVAPNSKSHSRHKVVMR